MRITITKTIDISAENEGLLAVIAADRGYREGDVREYSCAFLRMKEKQDTIDLISPSVTSYFGGIQKEQGDAVKAQLPDAVTVEVTIV